MDGEFKVGATGWLKPVGGPKTKTQLESINEPYQFCAISRLPLCTMRFNHELVAIGTGTQATHTVSFDGLLAPVFQKLIGPKIEKGIAGTMQGLKTYAESNVH